MTIIFRSWLLCCSSFILCLLLLQCYHWLGLPLPHLLLQLQTSMEGNLWKFNLNLHWDLISRVDQIKYDLEELPVHGELVNRLHMSKVPYRKRREEGITGPLEVVLCQYKPYP